MQTHVAERPSVLVVDDNPLITKVLQGLFGSEQYAVYSCSNGEEALSLLDRKPVDVIVCDVMMPRMDGYELHRLVREKASFCHIPFVFLTALGGDEVRKGKAQGVDDYIVKPFDPEELLSVIRGKIERSRGLKNFSERQYDQFRRKIIHTLSHEFRTPLVAINTGTELLLEQDGSISGEKVQNLLGAIQRGGKRLERLVTDFMVIQQIEAGVAQKLFEDRAVDYRLHALLSEFTESKRQSLSEMGISLRVELEVPNSRIRVYEPQFLDVLGRILDNAVKFSASLKEVEIFAYELFNEAIIEIRDRGVGVDTDRLRSQLELFGQLDREKHEQQGSGFGLAICQRYLNILGGHIDFEARDGGGLAVAISVPLANSNK